MMKFATSLISTLVLSASFISTGSAQGTPAQGSAALTAGTAGVGPLVDAINDLGVQNEFNTDSFYATGFFTASGQKLHYLYHVRVLHTPGAPDLVTQNVAITNSTTSTFRGSSTTTASTLGSVGPTNISISTPTGSINGNFDDLHVVATMEGAEFDIHLKAGGPALYNGGTGVFPLLGMQIHQYSVPIMPSSGTIKLDGTTYSVNGNSWFDRQWQNTDQNVAIKWSWMGVNLANGEALSIWSAADPAIGKNRAWATILHTDGSQSVAAVEPTLGASDFWISALSGNRYPGKWQVRIPQFGAVLDVVPLPREQELMISTVPLYQGGSAVSGVYKGKPITGTARVEMLGVFQ